MQQEPFRSFFGASFGTGASFLGMFALRDFGLEAGLSDGISSLAGGVVAPLLVTAGSSFAQFSASAKTAALFSSIAWCSVFPHLGNFDSSKKRWAALGAAVGLYFAMELIQDSNPLMTIGPGLIAHAISNKGRF